MSLPCITDTALGYIFKWEEEKVSIEVSRINVTRNSINGEIAVSTTLPSYSPHLHQARFSFTNTKSRKDLQKTLEAQCDKVDWYPILEQLCVYTLRKIREGEPTKTIWTSVETKPPQYLLEPFIIRNYPTIIFGDPSAGKSIFSQLLITVLTLPWYDNLLGLSVIEQAQSCLIFDYETDEDTVGWQLGCLQRGMGLPEFSINYRRSFLPLHEDLEEALKAIEECKATVSIIDSIGPACGGELNEAGPVLAFFNAIRRLNTTAILLAHNQKSSESKNKSPYGSIYFQAMARSIWEIRKTQEAGEDEMNIGLFHKKPPPFSKLSKPLGFKFIFSDTTTIIEMQDPRTVAEFLERHGAAVRIAEMLKAGAADASLIMETLELTKSNTYTALKRMKDKGQIVKLPDDKWGLKASV